MFGKRSYLLYHCSVGLRIAQTPFSDSQAVHLFPSGLTWQLNQDLEL